MQILNSWIAQEKPLYWGRPNFRSFGNDLCPGRALSRAQQYPSHCRTAPRHLLCQGIFQMEVFAKHKVPMASSLNSQIHRGFLSQPNWDTSWLQTMADHKFTMVHYPPSQENINSIILIYMAAIFHWVGIKAFFESKMPRKGVKNQILLVGKKYSKTSLLKVIKLYPQTKPSSLLLFLLSRGYRQSKCILTFGSKGRREICDTEWMRKGDVSEALHMQACSDRIAKIFMAIKHSNLSSV